MKSTMAQCVRAARWWMADRGYSPTHVSWGVAGVVVSVVALVAAGVVYVLPFGEQTYTADFRISGGARPGDEVRIAGIDVGSVRSVELAGDHVEVRFTVDRDVHVGRDSAVAVKMLTPIGGHYLALQPRGEKPLGDGHIPPEHTSTPFDLNDIIDTATPVLSEIDGGTLRATVSEVNRALAGGPDGIRNVLGSVTGLTGSLAQRADQIDRAVEVADEYVAAIADDRQLLADVVHELGIVAVTLAPAKDDIVRVFTLLRRFLDLLHRPVMAYEAAIEPSVMEFEQLANSLLANPQVIDQVVAGIEDFLAKITAMLGDGDVVMAPPPAHGSGPAVCIPYAGKVC